ncbi:MAG: LPP20 family lipoprotein, partial [Betaproteobacteria bacterium]|nr:LPP20 family lipoprotein [Betaproteobacteria bacterium]
MRSPPADTAALYYGIGEGPDLDSAKRAALRDVAAKLRVSIRATTDTQVTVANDVADRFSRSRVSEEVRNT